MVSQTPDTLFDEGAVYSYPRREPDDEAMLQESSCVYAVSVPLPESSSELDEWEVGSGQAPEGTKGLNRLEFSAPSPSALPEIGVQDDVPWFDALSAIDPDETQDDLLGEIPSMHRLLDLVYETGSAGQGGLVEKIIIDHDSLGSLLNRALPGSYRSISSIDFKSLDNITVKPKGVYGTRPEIANFLASINAIDNDLAQLLAQPEEELMPRSRKDLDDGARSILMDNGLKDKYPHLFDHYDSEIRKATEHRDREIEDETQLIRTQLERERGEVERYIRKIARRNHGEIRKYIHAQQVSNTDSDICMTNLDEYPPLAELDRQSLNHPPLAHVQSEKFQELKTVILAIRDEFVKKPHSPEEQSIIIERLRKEPVQTPAGSRPSAKGSSSPGGWKRVAAVFTYSDSKNKETTKQGQGSLSDLEFLRDLEEWTKSYPSLLALREEIAGYLTIYLTSEEDGYVTANLTHVVDGTGRIRVEKCKRRTMGSLGADDRTLTARAIAFRLSPLAYLLGLLVKFNGVCRVNVLEPNGIVLVFLLGRCSPLAESHRVDLADKDPDEHPHPSQGHGF
ncbi:hypothetical protein RSOLAG22IIIB_05479 [Rhizoctonia solani]|uniref:Uncharacterized protein n=1 Tax=Rhizoctonia solani TaxID=456999 RepID=A0A0K6G7A7_9AGAM|nr:hypothetical protein RSOLAG22IIIB_05479 [Rhizoctonia solani]